MRRISAWWNRILSIDSMGPAPPPTKPASVRCDTCKHWSRRTGAEKGRCEKIDDGVHVAEIVNEWDPQEVGSLFTSRDFGCTLWERREATDGVTPVPGKRVDLVVDTSEGPHGVYEVSVKKDGETTR